MMMSNTSPLKSDGWEVIDRYFFFDILPVNDSREHGQGDECWCYPKTERGSTMKTIVTHNSADGREAFEVIAKENK